jgi:hypothetical protein
MTRHALNPVPLAALVVALFAASTAGPHARAAVAQNQPAGPNPELLLDQGKRLFDGFQYDQAITQFNLIVSVLAGPPPQKPDLLVQALELRARSKFALADQPGAEQDFQTLLMVNPSYKLGAGISPRVVSIFEAIRKKSVGQVMLSMTPPGEIRVDGRVVTASATPQVVDMPAGEHQVEVKRQGYRPVAQRFTVEPGTSVPLAIELERISSTLTVLTIPEGVEVVVDGTSRGVTVRGDTSTGPSAPLVVADLTNGNHRLQLKRACFQDVERTFMLDKPDDMRMDPLRLPPAVATVKIEAAGQSGSVFLDGVSQGTVPTQINNHFAGTHLIEVRGPRGRFIDRREWKTGETATIVAEQRTAYPIVAASAPAAAALAQLRSNVEQSLAASRRVLIFAPPDAEVEAALRGENAPPNWLTPAAPGSSPAGSRPPREVLRDLGRRVATKLNAQGVAAVSVGTDPYQVSLALLAAGSGDPEVITFNLGDQASRARAIERLSAPMPLMMRPSIETSVIDLVGVEGAVVVRPGGSGAKAGLAVGDVIVGAGGTTITSVAELRAKIAALKPPSVDLPLSVKGPTGATRNVAGAVTMAPDTLPLRDTTLTYNRALPEIEEAVRQATGGVDAQAARLNLAIVQMRLGNYDLAEAELRNVNLPEGAGVSAGTVAYFTGLCLESLGRTADARAAFTKAAASPLARVSSEGPLVAPLAKAKIAR